MAMGHEAHAAGEYSSLCRACRIQGDLERIEVLALGKALHCEYRNDARVRPCHARTSVACRYCRRPICPEHQAAHRAERHNASDLAAREAIGRCLWSEPQLAALRVAVIARTPLHDVLTWAEHATREVTGGRR